MFSVVRTTSPDPRQTAPAVEEEEEEEEEDQVEEECPFGVVDSGVFFVVVVVVDVEIQRPSLVSADGKKDKKTIKAMEEDGRWKMEED